MTTSNPVDHKNLRPYPQLLFLVAPLLVYFFGTLLFELSVDPRYPVIMKLVGVAKSQGPFGLNHVLIEMKSRYTWLASAILSIVIPTIAIIFSIVTIRAYLKGKKLAWTVIVGVILCLGNLAFLRYNFRAGSALYDLVFGFTYNILAQSNLFSQIFLQHIYKIIVTINILAAITPILLLLAVFRNVSLKGE